jgi:regulator of sirC expression with transglutaminase-like and TPR domain
MEQETEMERKILDDLIALAREQIEHARRTEQSARELLKRISQEVR